MRVRPPLQMLSFIVFVLYYLVLPLAIIHMVQRFFKKYASHQAPAPVLRLYQDRPIEKKWFRLVRFPIGSEVPEFLADFETHQDAVDAAYAGKKKDAASGLPESVLPAYQVLNDQGQALEQV